MLAEMRESLAPLISPIEPTLNSNSEAYSGTLSRLKLRRFKATLGKFGQTVVRIWTTSGEKGENVAVNFFISVNFWFSFVLNSLAYITIHRNNGKIKIN